METVAVCFKCGRDRSEDDVSGEGRACPDCGWNDEDNEGDLFKFEERWIGKMLREADDVTPEIEKHIESAVEWFDDSPTMGTEEFIDRLCNTYGGDDFDMDSYDNPAARKIMRIARRIRKESRE